MQWRRADIGSVRKPCDSDAFARKNIQIWHILHFMVFLSLFYLRTASALYSSVSDDFRISMRLTPSCLIIAFCSEENIIPFMICCLSENKAWHHTLCYEFFAQINSKNIFYTRIYLLHKYLLDVLINTIAWGHTVETIAFLSCLNWSNSLV